MKWEVVIGLEIHAQLSTQSKIFSGASTAFGAAPNTQASAVDLALPGVLPVLNREAVNKAIRLGLALGSKINRVNIFDRKNYFYPDLPKGYQISQLNLPIIEGGKIAIQVGDTEKIINLTRAHLEEDAGKSLHEDFNGMSGIDLNRAGTPLLEIVSEPEMRSAAEAVAYAKAMHSLVTWIGICDGNMQEGSFRCDVNVSVRPEGQQAFGTRREIKNLNSFKFMEQAIKYEVQWQIEQIEDGHAIQQATVLFNPDTGETRSMRSKEDAHDYRYFPDPDLLPVHISEDWIERVKNEMPELPNAKAARYACQYGLSAYDAKTLTSSLATAHYFEEVLQHFTGEAKLAANWIMGDLSAQLNRAELDIQQSPVNAVQLAQILTRIADNTLSGSSAKKVFQALFEGEGSDVDTLIEAKGLRQMNDTGALEAIIDSIIAANPAQTADYRAGKDKLFGFFVGQVMKASKGTANPAQLNDLLKQKLAG